MNIKNTQKSIRFSKETYDYVNRRKGTSFNGKLEELILECKNLEAQKIEKIKQLDDIIEQKQEKIQSLSNKIYTALDILSDAREIEKLRKQMCSYLQEDNENV